MLDGNIGSEPNVENFFNEVGIASNQIAYQLISMCERMQGMSRGGSDRRLQIARPRICDAVQRITTGTWAGKSKCNHWRIHCYASRKFNPFDTPSWCVSRFGHFRLASQIFPTYGDSSTEITKRLNRPYVKSASFGG